MCLQVRWKLAQILKHAGECALVQAENGILWIHHVERHCSVIHVHNDLYGVADVVHVLRRAACLYV